MNGRAVLAELEGCHEWQPFFVGLILKMSCELSCIVAGHFQKVRSAVRNAAGPLCFFPQ